jgi:hypothetical protein
VKNKDTLDYRNVNFECENHTASSVKTTLEF